jgi:hypothetical protein
VARGLGGEPTPSGACPLSGAAVLTADVRRLGRETEKELRPLSLRTAVAGQHLTQIWWLLRDRRVAEPPSQSPCSSVAVHILRDHRVSDGAGLGSAVSRGRRRTAWWGWSIRRPPSCRWSTGSTGTTAPSGHCRAQVEDEVRGYLVSAPLRLGAQPSRVRAGVHDRRRLQASYRQTGAAAPHARSVHPPRLENVDQVAELLRMRLLLESLL